MHGLNAARRYKCETPPDMLYRLLYRVFKGIWLFPLCQQVLLGAGMRWRKYVPVMLAALLVVVVLVQQVSACFDPADAYAVEVVLNAPGIEYNLSALSGAALIDYAGGTAFAYRSRYNNRLVVVVSEQELEPGSGSKHLAVRIQSPVTTREYRVYRCVLPSSCSWKLRERVPLSFTAGEGELTLELGTLCCDSPCWVRFKPLITASVCDNATLLVSGTLALKGVQRVRTPEGGGSELEYRVNMPCLLSVGEPCIRVMVLIPGYDAPMRIEAGEYQLELTLLWHASAAAEGLLERVEVECSCLKVAPMEEPLRDLGWHVEEGGELARKVGDSTVRVSSAGGELELSIESVEELGEKDLEEVRRQLEGLGFAPEILRACNFTVTREYKILPHTDVNESEVIAALKAELEWLVRSGVISGLDPSEIARIASAAKLGYAGWNRRIVWYNGDWVPYSSVPGAALVRCYGGVQPAFQAESKVYGNLPQAPLGGSQESASALQVSESQPQYGWRTTSWLWALAVAALAALAAAGIAYAAVKKSLPA